jgi:hypothetical protein
MCVCAWALSICKVRFSFASAAASYALLKCLLPRLSSLSHRRECYFRRTKRPLFSGQSVSLSVSVAKCPLFSLELVICPSQFASVPCYFVYLLAVRMKSYFRHLAKRGDLNGRDGNLQKRDCAPSSTSDYFLFFSMINDRTPHEDSQISLPTKINVSRGMFLCVEGLRINERCVILQGFIRFSCCSIRKDPKAVIDLKTELDVCILPKFKLQFPWNS